jgi:hypothetical protein
VDQLERMSSRALGFKPSVSTGTSVGEELSQPVCQRGEERGRTNQRGLMGVEETEGSAGQGGKGELEGLRQQTEVATHA